MLTIAYRVVPEYCSSNANEFVGDFEDVVDYIGSVLNFHEITGDGGLVVWKRMFGILRQHFNFHEYHLKEEFMFGKVCSEYFDNIYGPT